jgi:hypothetical protein
MATVEMISAVTGVPAVKGTYTFFDGGGSFDGRYRVWTAEHGLNWRDHFKGPEGWILVGVDGWQANPMRSVWNDERGGWDTLPGEQVQLAVFNTERGGERHPELDHTRYDSWEQAYDAAWAAGLLGLMIYDKHAGYRGLVDAVIRWEDAEQEAGRLARTDRQTGGGTTDWWVYDWAWQLDTERYAAAVRAGVA